MSRQERPSMPLLTISEDPVIAHLTGPAERPFCALEVVKEVLGASVGLRKVSVGDYRFGCLID